MQQMRLLHPEAIFVAAPLIKTAWIIPSTNATLWKIGDNFAWSTSSINTVNVALARYANSLCTLLKSTSEFYQFSLAYGPHNGRKSLSVINEVNNVAYRHGRGRGPFNGSLVPGDINEIQRVCSSAFPRFPECIIDHELNSRTRKTVIKNFVLKFCQKIIMCIVHRDINKLKRLWCGYT